MSSERSEPKTVTVHVPMTFKVYGGRKTIVAELTSAPPMPPRTENALLKALAKAFRWRKQIEDGDFPSITELAKAKGVNDSYACRILRLTLLSPELISSALDGRTPHLTLKMLARRMPLDWTRQKQEME